MSHVHVPVLSERLLLVGKVLVGLATLAVVVYICVLVYLQDSEFDKAQGVIEDHGEAISEAEADRVRLDAALEKANERLKAHELPPVPVPSAPPPDSLEPLSRGQQGLRGPGPTRAQVAAAVATECADGCVSLAQLNAAVERYCAANACGTPGPTGGQGDPGPVGPGASDEQVQAQVDAYCAANPCGTPGPKGERGEPGTAVAGEYLCSDGEWLFGFVVATDGNVTLRCQQGFPIPRP